MKKIVLALTGLFTAFQLLAADAGWITPLQNPLAKARMEHKLVLLDFTGSDWCPWCKRFKSEIFDTPQFTQYAKSNLVLVELDFPHDVPQTNALKKANAAWQQKYKPNGFPTVVLIDTDGKELGRFKGFDEGGAADVISSLDDWKASAPAKPATPAPVAASQGAAGGPQWLTSLSLAQAKARAEKKMVLLDFNGSDWCGWCIRLKQEVFSQPEFVAYAQKNLVLVDLDFPHKKPQTPELKAANEQLAQKYNIQGFPTVIILDSNGKAIASDGYKEGGPGPYIAMLDALKKSAQ